MTSWLTSDQSKARGETADGRALFVYQHLYKGDSPITGRRDIALFDSCPLCASAPPARRLKALPSLCTLAQLPVDKTQWSTCQVFLLLLLLLF